MRNKTFWVFLAIVAVGTAARLGLAYFFTGNWDMRSWTIDAEIAARGGNVYAETHLYNYTPLWFLILGAIKNFQNCCPFFPLHFLIKGFLCVVDLLILFCLVAIARHEKISVLKTAAFFYLNPISILCTGFHGQFENLALLPVLFGLWSFKKCGVTSKVGKGALWLFSTLGLVIKHNIFYELIIVLNATIRRPWVRATLFSLSVLIFFALFIPYWAEGRDGILKNVFSYSPPYSDYGMQTLIRRWASFRFVFVAGLCLFPFLIQKKELVVQCLLGTLFFLIFTTGVGIQYFVLPVAFAALRPSKTFLIFTGVTALYMLGSKNYFHLYPFYFIRGNLVWLSALYWFIELMKKNEKGRAAA